MSFFVLGIRYRLTLSSTLLYLYKISEAICLNLCTWHCSCSRRLVCHLHLIAFHGTSSVERKRFTQHSFKALSNTVKSVMFRPPSSLHFMIVDFLILGCLYFQMNLKNYFVDLFGKAIGGVKHAVN